MNFLAITAWLDELEKLGAVTPGQAQSALDRLDAMEKNKFTASQVGRYAGLGAITAPAVGLLRSAIAKRPYVHPGGSMMRTLAGDAAQGAIAMGALPLIRGHLDRRAEAGTLKKFLKENQPQQG